MKPATHILRRWRRWAALFLAVGCGFTAAGAETNAPTRSLPARPAQTTDYASFRIIGDRNIFNTRRGRPVTRTVQETRRPPRVDTFSLVGTLSYEKGWFAFFDGSSSEFRKVLKPEGRIGGCKITEVTATSVKLEAADRKIELGVGMQLRREDEGEWRLGTRGDAHASTGGGPPSETSATRESAGNGAGGEVSDVLTRMMQQREQDLK